MDIPNTDRERDNDGLPDKETIHEMNKKLEHEAHAHENPNLSQGKDHNPKHSGIGGK